ncbi:MAG: hypothetical protein U0234_03465 [Sandaracinus sp.]
MASATWTTTYVLMAVLFVAYVRELSWLGVPVCVGLVPTIAVLGLGQSAVRRARWLAADLGSGQVRVFEGELIPREDPAVDFLAKRSPSLAAGGTRRLELLASGLPLPALGERFAPYPARPFRVALPPSVAAPGVTRVLSRAERDELHARATRARRIRLEHGVVIVGSLLAAAAVTRWVWSGVPWDRSAFHGVRGVVFSALGVASAVSLWHRRREAAELDAAARSGEVTGTGVGEQLPSGLVWTEGGRPARWRRS